MSKLKFKVQAFQGDHIQHDPYEFILIERFPEKGTYELPQRQRGIKNLTFNYREGGEA